MLRLIAQNTDSPRIVPLMRRAPNVGNEKPGLPRQAFDGMRGIGKIKNRNAFNAESAAVDFRVAADFHLNLVRIELPFRARQFAGGDRSVVDQVVVGPGLLHHFAGKGEGVGRGQDHSLAAKSMPVVPVTFSKRPASDRTL